MKSVFIVYNQALTERIDEMLNRLNVRGFTQWKDVMGRGTETGEPHMGTHTWPVMNSATMCMVDDTMAVKLLEGVKKLNESAQLQGIRAFVWDIEGTV